MLFALALPLLVAACGDGNTPKPMSDTSVAGDVQASGCELAPCRNGGRCVETGQGPACDCPPSTFGPGCEAFCPDAPLVSAGCKAIDAPSWVRTGDTTTCAWPERFEFSPDQPGGTVTVGVVFSDQLEFFAMVGPDGSGRYTTEILLPGGVTTEYAFFIDGEQITEALSRTAAACGEAPPSPSCTALSRPAGLDLTCGQGAGCVDGRVDGFWLALTAPRDRLVTGLRFRADWWLGRPKRYEVWAADTLALTPGDPGTTLVTTTQAREAPWQCVTGEPCSDEVPDVCCPDSREQPQRIEEGALIAKWDEVRFPGVRAAAIHLRVLETANPQTLLIEEVELIGNVCVDAVGGVRPQPPCRAWGVGEEAGCSAGEWCPPFAENEPAGTPMDRVYSPRCVTPGIVGLGGPCTGANDCALGAVCAGGRCARACEEGGPTCGQDQPRCTSPFSPSLLDSTWGFCDHSRCTQPFGAECGATRWCAPTAPSPLCLPRVGVAAGEACTHQDQCGVNALCRDGVCYGTCSRDAGPSGACNDAALTCVPFDDGSPAICETGCDYGTASSCGEGEYCWPREASALDGDICLDVPSHWPGPQGFEPFSPCTEVGQPCAPLSYCLGDRRCVPLCRLSAGPAGPAHPDCPTGVECGPGPPGAEFGICVQ